MGKIRSKEGRNREFILLKALMGICCYSREKLVYLSSAFPFVDGGGAFISPDYRKAVLQNFYFERLI
jgi:hypothetical protein